MNVALVTLVINNTPTMQDTLQLVFNGFPTVDDVRSQIGEDKFIELLDRREVEDFEEYVEDYNNNGTITFECLDIQSKYVGCITIEQKECTNSSLIEIED